jgi:hypothetical protein
VFIKLYVCMYVWMDACVYGCIYMGRAMAQVVSHWPFTVEA